MTRPSLPGTRLSPRRCRLAAARRSRAEAPRRPDECHPLLGERAVCSRSGERDRSIHEDTHRGRQDSRLGIRRRHRRRAGRGNRRALRLARRRKGDCGIHVLRGRRQAPGGGQDRNRSSRSNRTGGHAVIARIVDWCTHNVAIVIGVAVFLVFAGEMSRRELSRDAVPDLSDPQIGIVVDWNGHPSTEVAARVTRVLTEALGSVSGAATVRSSSMSGTAYVDVIFGSASGLDEHRREIEDRVTKVRDKLPANVRIEIGPTASSTGWIYQYALVNPSRRGVSPALRQLQETLFRPALEAIPGVAEVASVGAPIDELLVDAPPEDMRARGVAFSDVASAGWLRSHTGTGKNVRFEEPTSRPHRRRRASVTSSTSRSREISPSGLPTSKDPSPRSAALSSPSGEPTRKRSSNRCRRSSRTSGCCCRGT